MLTYKSSGVDIDEGNRAVDLIKNKIKGTYDSNVIGDLGNFSGLYSLKDFMGMEEPVLLASTDGVGTNGQARYSWYRPGCHVCKRFDLSGGQATILPRLYSPRQVGA